MRPAGPAPMTATRGGAQALFVNNSTYYFEAYVAWLDAAIGAVL